MGKIHQWGTSVLLAAAFSVSATAGVLSEPMDLPPPTSLPDSKEAYYFQEGPLKPYSDSPVEVRLILAFDGSSSMSSEEYKVQVFGAANSLTSDTVKNAWFGFPANRDSGPVESVAIGVVVYDSYARMRVPWVDFRRDDPNLDERLEHFAEYLRSLVKTRDTEYNGSTHIGEALYASEMMFKNAPWKSLGRDVIDLSGDGENNGGRELPAIKKTMADMDVTINGLAIINEEPDLDTYYKTNLITRADEETNALQGDVWIVAHNLPSESNSEGDYLYFQEQYEKALKEKLVWEVAGIAPDSPLFYREEISPVLRNPIASVSIQPVSYKPH